MTRDRKLLLLGLGLAINVVVAHQFYKAHYQDKRFDRDIVDSKVQEAKHEEQKKVTARTDVVVDAIEKKRTKTRIKADSVAIVADTLGQGAQTVRDSLEMWHDRYVERTEEAQILRSDSADAAAVINLLRGDRDRWRIVAERSNHFNATLRKDLELARAGCRIIIVRCPTRKEAAVAGVIAGAVITLSR